MSPFLLNVFSSRGITPSRILSFIDSVLQDFKKGSEENSGLIIPDPRYSLEYSLLFKTLTLIEDRNLDGVIFDADGTLFKSEFYQWLAFSFILRKLGADFSIEENQQRIDSHDYEDFREMLNSKLGNAKVSDLNADDIISMVNRTLKVLFKTRRSQMLRPEVLETLQALKCHGFPIGIASSSSRKSLEVKLGSTGISGFFDCIVCGDEVRYKKPNPEPLCLVAEGLGLPTGQIVVIEDSLNGIKAAKNAGCHGICYLDVAEVERMLRDDHVHDIRNLYDNLYKIQTIIELLLPV
jgi:beta-phosphoglucomutase